MEKTKLYLLINSLAENDIHALNVFVEHEDFKNQAIEKRLIQYLIANQGSKPRISKEVILNNLFADEPRVTLNSLKHYSGKAFKIINKFLVYSSAMKNPVISNSILMDYYVERGLAGKMTTGLIKQMENYIDENRNYYHHLDKFKIHQWRAMFEKVEEKDTTKHLQKCSDSLDAFYVENKLRIYAEIQAKRVDARSGFDDFLMSLVPAYESEMQPKNEVVDIFHFIYDALLNEEYGDMDYLIEKIISGSYPNFEKFLEKSILGYLINYCITEINNKNPEYAQKYIEINNHLRDKDVFLDSNQISWQRYKNTITALLIKDNTDWSNVRKFMDTYKSHLPESFQEQAKILANIQFDYTFHNRVTETDIGKFSEFNLKHTIWNISFYRLLIKLYYETDQQKLLPVLKILKKYISRRKNESGKKAMSESMYIRVKGFINIVSKMMKEKEISIKELEETKLYGVDYLWLMKHIK